MAPRLLTTLLFLSAFVAQSASVLAKDNAAGDWAKRAAGAANGITKKNDDAAPSETNDGDAAAEQQDAQPPEKADAPEATADMSDWKQHVVSPIFSELVMFTMPGNFIVAFEDTKNGFYIREAVPKGETVEQWSEMITVTGNKGLAAKPDVTPQSYFQYFASRFSKACPGSFSAQPVDAPEVKDHESFAGIASCGTVSGRSETTVFLIIKGANDYYTIQWAKRGEPSQDPVEIDTTEWSARVAKLNPVHACVRKAGEKAPYPSCLPD